MGVGARQGGAPCILSVQRLGSVGNTRNIAHRAHRLKRTRKFARVIWKCKAAGWVLPVATSFQNSLSFSLQSKLGTENCAPLSELTTKFAADRKFRKNEKTPAAMSDRD